MMKKSISLVLVLLMIVSIFTVAPFSASAESVAAAQTGSTAEDFAYHENFDGSNGVTIFEYIGSDTEVVIPSEIDGKPVTVIGNGTFSGCEEMTSITIPDSVTEIEYYAFYNCTSLTNIKIPDSVTVIGDMAFGGCSNLTSITIPDSVTYIDFGAFYDTAWYNNQPDGLIYAGKIAYEYKGNMPKNTSLVIKDGTKAISDYAFRDCVELVNITIPDSVTYIGSEALCDTGWYHSQPDGIIYAGKVAYKYKGDMPANTSLVLKDGTKTIGDGAFWNCTGLTSITIPDSVTKIGEGAFMYCAGLSSITIPDSVTEIDKDTFEWSGLTSVTIPDSITEIGVGTFGGCTELTNVTIGNSVKTIMWEAFWGCTGLTSVTIPKSVKTLYYYTFTHCTGLTSIEVDENNETYSSRDGVLYDKEKETLILCPEGKTGELVIPKSVKKIDVGAFYDCTGLTNITIPDSVTEIVSDAFYNCAGLTSITILSRVIDIKYSQLGYYIDYDEGERRKIKGFTIYGYSNSYAQEYADENDIPFVALSTLEDRDTKIIVTGDIDDSVELSISEVKVDEVNIGDSKKTVLACYDITLTENGEEVQPNGLVQVKIPFAGDYENVGVYRINDDGTSEKMQSSYDGEYITFVTDHFSKYAIVAEEDTPLILGDVDGNGVVDITDATYIQRELAKLPNPFELNKMTADIDGDGIVSIVDATYIQRYLARYDDSLNIGKSI